MMGKFFVVIFPVVLGVPGFRPDRLSAEEDISFDVDIGVLGDFSFRKRVRASGSRDDRWGVSRGVFSRMFYKRREYC